VPRAQIYREKYVPRVRSKLDAENEATYTGKDIMVQMDESTDAKGRKVIITIFITEDIINVVDVSFMSTVDNASIQHLMGYVLGRMCIQQNQVIGFIHDSAAYMMKAARTMAGINIHPRCIDIPCNAHIY